MNIETTKLELMHLLLQTQQESLLIKLKKVFDEELGDWWDEMSFEEQQQVDKGLEQANNQEYTSHNEAMKLFDKWH